VPSNTWHPAGYAKDTLLYLLKTQFEKYANDVEKASKDCAAAVRRLVSKGPPDLAALPLPEGDTHVEAIWFQHSDEQVSARLNGAPVGSARDELWKAQQEALAAMEAAEASGA
jgi:hypothetical protein